MSVKHIVIPIPVNVISDSFELMQRQIGLKELTGRNDGDHIKAYHELYRLAYRKNKTNYPYCQMAQGYWLYVANGNSWNGIEFMKTAGTAKAVQLALKQGILQNKDMPIKRHSLLYWKKKHSYQGHVERVYKDFDGLVGETIGANTSNGKHGSQREGNGIFKRLRDFSKPIGSLQPYAVIHFDLIPFNMTDSDILGKTV